MAPWLASVLAVIGFGLVLLAYEVYPVSYVWLIAEDSWGENGTFFAWLLAFVVLARAMGQRPGLRRPGFILLAVVALFVAVEEISWGQRILDYESPEFFERYNRQSELTFHNFMPNPDREPIGAILLLGTVLPFLASRLLPGLRAWMERWGLPPVPLRLWPMMAVTAWLFFDPWSMHKLDEVSELFLGVTALLFALEIVKDDATGDNAGAVAGTIALAALGAVLMTVAVGKESNYRRWLGDLASSRFPYRGQLEQSVTIFEYLADRPELRRSDTWLNYALVLASLEEDVRARDAARRGLAEQDERLEEKPRDERAHRLRGRLLAMLGRDDAAAESFAAALELDRDDLEDPDDLEDEVELRWSIAETLYAMGDTDGAAREAEEAAEMAEDENTTKKILRWLQWEERRTEVLGAARPLRPSAAGGQP